MYKDGHWGIGFILFSPIAFALVYVDKLWLFWFSLSAYFFLITHPDIDMKLQRYTYSLQSVPLIGLVTPKIQHRKQTHTVWYAIFWAILFGVTGALLSGVVEPVSQNPTVQMLAIGLFGGFIGFFGIIAHLLGDVLTPSGIQPFAPISNKKYTLSLVYAKNFWANKGLFVLGMITMTGAVYLGFAY